MKNKITKPGIIITILASLFFTWSIYQWVYILDYSNEVTENDIINNEIEAFNNLKIIIEAQNEFYSKDLDGDGVKNYVEFLPHLWIYACKGIEPLKLKLIPEDVAFSKSSQNGCKGYIFTGLQKTNINSDEDKKLRFTKEWAAIAYPKNLNISGRLTYITDQNNDIFAKKDVYNLKFYPTDPKKEGWVKILSEEDVRRGF